MQKHPNKINVLTLDWWILIIVIRYFNSKYSYSSDLEKIDIGLYKMIIFIYLCANILGHKST